LSLKNIFCLLIISKKIKYDILSYLGTNIFKIEERQKNINEEKQMKSITASLRRFGLAVLTVVLVVSSFVVFAPSASAETYTIKLGSDKGMLAFEPAKLKIKPGDTIKWVNNKVPPHNVVFDGAKNAAKSTDFAKALSHKKLMIKPGEATETNFPADAPAGDYTFYCEPHRGAGMVGKITVEG
jgi:plastocyanin